MLLNEAQSLLKTRKLLDDPTVYKYADEILEITTSTGIVTSTGLTAIDQMEQDLLTIADEIYIDEMLTTISSSYYDTIKAKAFVDYTTNDKRLFYAECYFVAAKFLKAWSLRNETELQKTNYDYSTKVVGTEKSGKLYTADQYERTANGYIAEWEKDYYSADEDSYYGRNKKSVMSISRY